MALRERSDRPGAPVRATGTDDAVPALPPAPSLRGATRAAVSDLYFNSWRLVPANLLWGVGLGLAYLVSLVFWPAALVLAPLLALPTVGIFRIASLAVRGDSVSFWDGMRAWRQYLVPGLLVGAVTEICGLVLLINLAGGLQSGDLIGWVFATLAGWGIVTGWLWLLCFWPLLTDPRREDWGVRRVARASAYLVIAHPLRLGGLGLVVAVLLAASTVAFAALISISVAFTGLLACRYVLPAADRLEARLAAGGTHLAPSHDMTGDTRAERLPAA